MRNRRSSQEPDDRLGDAGTPLPEGETLFRTAFEHAPIGMALGSRDGRWLSVNPALAEMLGYPVGELRGRRPTEFTHPEDVETSLALVARLWAGEISSFQVEKRYLHRDGSVVWADLHIRLVRGGDGEPVCTIGQVLDITERKLAEEELLRRDATLEAVAAIAGLLLAAPRWEEAVDGALQSLGQATEASRVYVFDRPDPTVSVIRQRFEWVADGIMPEIGNERLQRLDLAGPGYQAWHDAFQAGAAIQIHVRDLPEPARGDGEQQGIRSLLGVPIMVGGAWWGYIGLDDCVHERVWPAAEIDALRAAADLLAGAIERQLAIESRHEAEERYRALVENLPLTTYIDRADETASSVYISPQIERVLGYPVQEWLDDPAFLTKVLHPDDLAEFTRSAWPEGPGPHQHDYRLIAKDDRVVWFHDEFHIVMEHGERYSRGFMIDITERKEMEEALRQTNQTLKALVEASPLAIVVTDLEQKVLLWNPAAERMYGWTADEVLGQPIRTRPSELAAEYRAFDRASAHGERIAGYETYRLRKDGRRIEVGVWRSPLHDATGRLVGTLGVHVDITDAKRAELALREREKRFRAVFDSALDALFIIDDDLTCLEANDAAAQLYGLPRDELLGQPADSLLTPESPDTLERMWGQFLESGTMRGEHDFVRADGALRSIELAGRAHFLPGRHLVMVRDVTDRRALEAQLQRSQRMEAIGRLAGGIAHDFNNLLTAISGYSDFLIKGLEEDSPLSRDAHEIARAADRAAALVSQLLAFGRRQMLRPRVLDLNAIVRETETMLRRLIGEDVELVTRLDPALEPLTADPAQLEQMIINLAVNARDAMPEGGTLAIETANVDLSAAQATPLSLPAGRYVHVKVADDGLGMDEQTRLQAFEPFFTTKEHGTGLGLSTVYGIVTGAGGQVEVESEPGQGTAFSIYLPAAAQPPETTDGAVAPGEIGAGSETVLLVEDEDVVRGLALRILRSGGYHVLQASCGEDALRVAAETAEPIDVLLTDVVMPGMNGRELADRLRHERPATCVVYMSGYTEDARLRSDAGERSAVFIAKPFTPTSLTCGVREALDASGARK